MNYYTREQNYTNSKYLFSKPISLKKYKYEFGPNELDDGSTSIPPFLLMTANTVFTTTNTTDSSSPTEEQVFKQLDLRKLNSRTAKNIAQPLGLEPISLSSESSKTSLLFPSTKKVIKRSLEQQEEFQNKPFKLVPCIKEPQDQNKTAELSLNHTYIMQNSPYFECLSKDSFVPLDQEHIDILNTSWEKKYHMKGASL